MKTYVNYVSDACEALDSWSSPKILAQPSKLETLTLALTMAIADLIKALEEKK